MHIGQGMRAYRAAEAGNAPPLPARLIEKVAHIHDWEERVDRAVELIIEARHASANIRGFGAPNAWKELDGTTEVEHHALMRIAVWLARGMMTYWVPDPDAESYCADCRKIKLLDEFEPDDRWKCKQCARRIDE
jgi:hypothetical protein